MIRAVINVHECDQCGNFESADSLNELAYHDFEARWQIGVVFDFCPNCKDSAQAQLCRKTEKQAAEIVFGETDEKAQKEEYAH